MVAMTCFALKEEVVDTVGVKSGRCEVSGILQITQIAFNSQCLVIGCDCALSDLLHETVDSVREGIGKLQIVLSNPVRIVRVCAAYFNFCENGQTHSAEICVAFVQALLRTDGNDVFLHRRAGMGLNLQPDWHGVQPGLRYV